MAIPLPARYICVECGETEVVLGDQAARSPDIRDQAERRRAGHGGGAADRAPPRPGGGVMNRIELNPQRAAELFAIRKTEWSAEEYRALVDRFADQVQMFQIGISNEDIRTVNAAYVELDRIAAQLREMNTGLLHALQAIQQQKESAR